MSTTDAPAGGSTKPSDNLKGAGLMLLAMASFTISDACMKVISELMPLYQAVTLRGMITLPVLLAIGALTGGLHFGRVWRARGLVGLRTLAEVGSTVTFFLGLVALPLAIVTSILQATPLAVTAAAAIFLGEKVGLPRLLAILVGLAGVLIIIRPGSDGFGMAAVFVLISVAFVVLRDLTTRRLPSHIPSATVAFLAALGVTGVSFVISLASPWQAVPLQVVPLLLLASGGVVVGYISVIRAMRAGEVSFITPFRYSALLWALFLGWLMFGYFPDGLTLMGAVLVVASGIFTVMREGRLMRSSSGSARR